MVSDDDKALVWLKEATSVRSGYEGDVRAMKKAKTQRLQAAGFRVGDAAEFLGLSDEEAAFVELKVALATFLRDVRRRRGWTQTQVARRLRSSQSRVAKMEAADPSVSLDLLVRALLALGASRREVGRVIERAA